MHVTAMFSAGVDVPLNFALEASGRWQKRTKTSEL